MKRNFRKSGVLLLPDPSAILLEMERPAALSCSAKRYFFRSSSWQATSSSLIAKSAARCQIKSFRKRKPCESPNSILPAPRSLAPNSPLPTLRSLPLAHNPPLPAPRSLPLAPCPSLPAPCSPLPAPRSFNLCQILSVFVSHTFAKLAQLLLANEAHTPSDFFRAANLQALAFFNGGDKIAGV